MIRYAALLLWIHLAGAQTFTGSIRTRVENWGWFKPETGDPTYTYSGSTLRFGISQSLPKFSWTFEVEAPLLLHLPSNAVAPGAQGQLGQGAGYYVANKGHSNAAMLFPKQAFVRWKLRGDAASLRVGRFEFQDGSETAAKDSAVATVKRDRIQQRMIGPFGFTHVMRSFDGLHFAYNKPAVNYTLIAAVPTRGVFQTDAWGWLRVAFAYASAAGQVQRKSSSAEWRLFAIYYHDWRHVNKPAAGLSNLRIGTYGGHYLQVTETPIGAVDMLGEVALQTGKWGPLDHRAAMVDVEAGLQPKILKSLKPWIRGGYTYGSGDGNASDKRHGTFFQMLPTARPYAQFPFYNMMNNVDRFAMLSLRPHARLTVKTELHSLRLASRNDLWYLGGGAFQPWSFGFQSRAAAGGSLANLVSIGAEFTINPHLLIAPYYGHAAGKSAIRSVYPRGADGHLAFLEMNYRF